MKHGTHSTYVTFKCRCELCREAHREAAREYRSRKRTQKSGGHGSDAMYLREGCRCDLCKAAHRETARLYRLERKSRIVEGINHGTEWSYRRYGCRCFVCVSEQKKRNKQHYLKHVLKFRNPVSPRPKSSVTQAQLDRALYHLKDGCSYAEAGRTVGMSGHTVKSYFPGYEGQGRLNMVEINSKPELKVLHDEIWNMKL